MAQEIGRLSQGPSAAEYRIQSMERLIDGRSFRLIVVYSSNLDARKQRALDSTLKKEEERLTRLISEAGRNRIPLRIGCLASDSEIL
ncbi:hypothetical protein P4H70_06735 [Paenibacillus ehimensis]|uniref:hypothetical protein n=1 Tax=Paenibacillus ehimensis TaxID=79264 RepID=UPI002DB69C8C|nr:hypothetical protein [Paenibacillus ehimensis]MEC0208642.1 hypothetical protein [Paenibacillus ehimensis]